MTTRIITISGSKKKYTDLKKLRTYLKMLQISAEMQKAGIRASDIYPISRKELYK